MEQRRRIATYMMVLGLLCAGAVLAVGRFEWWREGRQLDALQTKCTAQSLPPPVEVTWPHPRVFDPRDWIPPASGIQFIPDTGEAIYFDDKAKAWKPDCDGEELHRAAHERSLSGIQNEIEQAFSRRQQNWEGWQGALLLMLTLSLPRAWYFLLGRIGELSAAIRGPRP